MKKFILTILVASLGIMGLISSVQGEMVIASQDDLLGRYEKSDRAFRRLQIGKLVSYFHQRKIDEATVEKDFIRYIFDVNTGELVEEKRQWREGLPDHVAPVISQEQAESMVDGVIRFSRLYIISSETDVFRIEPIPENPCWVVSSNVGKRIVVTIIDAMTGEKLGYGLPPPYEGFSLRGPHEGDCNFWYNHAENARVWFEAMGYSTEMVACPSDGKVQSHIQSDDTAMFYELAHGTSVSFHNNNPDSVSITAAEVETWIASYASMPFTFIGSCGGMCDTSDNTLSYEFRKGYNVDAVSVGYCEMWIPGCEADCWPWAVEWQTEMFSYMYQGYTVGYAFDRANLAVPACADTNNCMRIIGDTQMTFIPPVTRSLCGDVYDGYKGPLAMNARDYYIRCDITVPSADTLTIYYSTGLAFMNDSKITSQGTLNADGSWGQIRFAVEGDSTKGMAFAGQFRMQNGGQIKIYE